VAGHLSCGDGERAPSRANEHSKEIIAPELIGWASRRAGTFSLGTAVRAQDQGRSRVNELAVFIVAGA
jgi:hypothetical protein